MNYTDSITLDVADVKGSLFARGDLLEGLEGSAFVVDVDVADLPSTSATSIRVMGTPEAVYIVADRYFAQMYAS